MKVSPHTPVLVGVGTAIPPPYAPGHGLSAASLMAMAAHAAADDAGAERAGGAAGLLAAVQQVAVPKGSWTEADPARLVADEIGAAHARTVLAQIGVPQQTLVNDALRRILTGELDVCLVTGGEAKRREVLARRAGIELITSPTSGNRGSSEGPADVVLSPSSELVAPPEISARMWEPVQQYAAIDNALRYGEGRSLDEHRNEIAALCSAFSAVAAGNPHAAFGKARPAAWIREPGPGNRPLAFPYNKWHVTQWTVDQAAALLLCSMEAAERLGVPRERWVFPWVALESSFALSLSRRRELHRWPAMGVLGQHAAAAIGRPLSSIEHTELYSCFPAAVRVQQRELGLALDGVPTVTGGMPFAGGPFNNFTYQATAAIVGRLRQSPGTLGLVTTVSGLLTKPGLAVWGTAPSPHPLEVADLADLADLAAAATASTPLTPAYEGPARVATYTVTYDPTTGLPNRVVVIADTSDDARCVAVSHDADLALEALNEELIGTKVTIVGAAGAPTFT